MRFKLLSVVALLALLAATYWLLHQSGALATILNEAALRDRITISVLALGGITLIPLAVKLVRDRLRGPPT